MLKNLFSLVWSMISQTLELDGSSSFVSLAPWAGVDARFAELGSVVAKNLGFLYI